MKENFKNLDLVYLHPGEICYSRKPVLVSTVLGSCISVIMHCKKKKFSGISHCQLPKCREQNNCSTPDAYKYVDCTITKMLERFEKQKIKIEDIEVKLFGGADVLTSLSGPGSPMTIGSQNIKMAVKYFKKNFLSVTASDTGGRKGRKLFFLTETGDVYLNRLKKYEKD